MVLSAATALAVTTLAHLASSSTLGAVVLLSADLDALADDRVRLLALTTGDVVDVVASGDRDPRELEAGVAAHPGPVFFRRSHFHRVHSSTLIQFNHEIKMGGGGGLNRTP
jgi:hypothetical protein